MPRRRIPCHPEPPMTSSHEDDPTLTRPETHDASSPSSGGAFESRLGVLASFSELDPGFLQHVESTMSERRFDAGAPLMRQGDDGDCLIVVQEGDVEVSVAHGQERHVLKRAGAGEVFGEMALLTREPRTATVVALTPVRALVLEV